MTSFRSPWTPARLRTILANATRQRDTAIELEVARRRLRETGILGSMVGSSAPMRDIFSLIEQIAPSNVSVLITGESGTGKEMVARTLHDLSPRKPRPFVAVNCAAMPETLIESELFGHEKGSFTGRSSGAQAALSWPREAPCCWMKSARCRWARRPSCCACWKSGSFAGWGRALSRKWTCGCWQPPIATPTRLWPAAQLRNDLYYRLNVFHIHMPPLREHMEDLPPMAEAMVREMNQKHGRRVSGVGPSMLDRMMAYDWPGNARELRNTIERAVILCPDGAPLDAGHLPPSFGKAQARAALALDANAVPVRVGTHGRRGRAAADSAHAGVHRAKQDPRRGDSGRQLEDPAQQAQGIQPGAGRPAGLDWDSSPEPKMRLKTKLVLAITSLVFLISGLLSLVYVTQLLNAAVKQSYDANKMVANQVRFALAEGARNRAEGPKGRSQQS